MTQARPAGFQSVTPMLMFKDARKAIDLYKRGLNAIERYAMPGPDGKGVMHAEIMIGDSIIMMGEESPNEPCKSAETSGSSPVSFYLYVADVDKAFQAALDAGCVTRMPVQDMFWGDRVGSLQDPFGYSWSLATHTRDLTDQEIQTGARAMFDQMAKK